MKRLFYLLIGLVLLPAFLYAQGTLSLKDINDNLTNNYYTKVASDARYPLDADTYDTAEVDAKLLLKADKTYVDASDEAIIVSLGSYALKTYVNATDETIMLDNDSQDVQIEANRVGVASLEVGLQTHQNNVSNPHAVTAAQVTASTIEVSDQTTVQLLLNEIGSSVNDQHFSGFMEWGGTGDYWQITGGAFELLRPGCGYIYGRKVNFTAPQTTGVLAANTEYYVYIDRNGVIQLTSDQSTAFHAIPLFEVLYDGTNYTVVKENHPYNFPTRASEYIHNNIGIIIRNAAGGANIDKLGTGTGADVADKQIELIGADVLEDHGLETTIPDSTGAAITVNYYYTDGSGKWIRYLSTTEVPLFYNNAGTPTALTSNYYGNYRLYVSKDNLNSTTPVYIGVMDDGNYANATQASNAITAGMPSATNELAGLELAQLGYVTVRNAGTYGHITVVDVEKSTLNGETTGSGASNIAALISTNAFTGILAGALNVQVALDIIDDWTILTDMDSAEAVIEQIHITDDSQDVAINATNIDVDSAEVAINLNNIDDDSQDVTIESNRVRVDSAEVAINGIIVGSGYATTAQVSQEVLVHNADANAHSTKFADYYTADQTDSTIEAAIAAIPVASQDFVKIGEYSPSGSAATYTISSISSDYRVLKLHINASTTQTTGNTDTVKVYLNSDTTNKYSASYTTSGGAITFNQAALLVTGYTIGSSADKSGSDIAVTINNSIAGAYKMIFVTGSSVFKSSTTVTADCEHPEYYFYDNTASLVSAITIFTGSSSNFSATSKFILYGLK